MERIGGKIVTLFFLLTTTVLVVYPAALVAEDSARAVDASGANFLRLTHERDNVPLALETAIVRCAPATAVGQRPLTVDLVAAVHIADKAYYQRLNREFRMYDAVLYELVTPEPSRAPRPSDPVGSHPISLLQNAMKDVLNLESQLKQIDYTAQNMVHADMSPAQMAESMREHGETPMTMLARMLGYALSHETAASSGPSSADMLMALFDKNRSLALKRILAEEFDSSQASMAALEGPAGSTLISGRNKIALKVLRKEIAAGKQKIAIFFGSAHMADFRSRLRDEFGLMPVSVRWLVAWDLKPHGNGR